MMPDTPHAAQPKADLSLAQIAQIGTAIAQAAGHPREGAPALPPPQVHPWLAQFPPRHQHYVRAWFAYAISQGARQPDVVVSMVSRLVRVAGIFVLMTCSGC